MKSMVVILVFLIVCGVAFLNFYESPEDKIKITEKRMQKIVEALEAYYRDNTSYPNKDQGLKALVKKPEVGVLPMMWRGPYLFLGERAEKTPGVPSDGWGNEFHYISNYDIFELRSYGADGEEGGYDLNEDIVKRD